MPPDDLLADTRQHYGFAQWPPEDAAPLFVHHWNYRPPMHSPGLLGVQRLPSLAMPHSLAALDYHLVFRDSGLVVVSLGECADAAHSRENLLAILTASMATGFPSARDMNLPVGEVAFASHREPVTWAGFVRHNLTLSMQSVGGAAIPVGPLARQLDQDIERWPTATDPQLAPQITELELGGLRVARGIRVPVRFTYRDRPEAQLSVRLRTTAGPIRREGRNLFIDALRSGKHDVDLALRSADGRVAHRTATFEVGP